MHVLQPAPWSQRQSHHTSLAVRQRATDTQPTHPERVHDFVGGGLEALDCSILHRRPEYLALRNLGPDLLPRHLATIFLLVAQGTAGGKAECMDA